MLRPFRLVRFDDAQSDQEAIKSAGATETQNVVPGEIHAMIINVTEPEIPIGDTGARYLLKRTPTNYLINQAYGLWVFASLFILTLIMTRKVSVEQYGIYAIASAAFNTIAYIIAFGLEDATVTFVPRILADHGRAAAALLVLRLLALRLAVLVLSCSSYLFDLLVLASLTYSMTILP